MISLALVFERMRQKPEAVRVRYLFFSVGISFVCIVALWAFSFQASFGTLLKNNAGDAVDAVRENARSVQASAPVSLEDLLKAGETLKEGVGQPPNEATRPSAPETSNFLPGNEVVVPSGGDADMSDAAIGSVPAGAPSTSSSNAAPTENSMMKLNQ